MPSIIPTVERESIDLNNRFVRTWNKELLRIAGIVARVAWTSEMAGLRAKLSSNILIAGKHYPSKEDIEKLLPETLFLQYVFSVRNTSLNKRTFSPTEDINLRSSLRTNLRVVKPLPSPSLPQLQKLVTWWRNPSGLATEKSQ